MNTDAFLYYSSKHPKNNNNMHSVYHFIIFTIEEWTSVHWNVSVENIKV